MTHPGVKFRGGDRWITPQPHEYVFRATGGFSGGVVDESTVRTQVGTPLAGGVTIANFVCPASVTDAGVLIVGVSASDNGAGSTVNTVTWNGHTLANLAEAVHSGNLSSASLHGYLLEPADLGATSNIVVDFDAASVGNSLVCAYVVGGVAYAAPDVTDTAEATNSATIALPLTPSFANEVILDWLTHVYSGAAPTPAATGDNVAIAGAALNDATSLLGAGSSSGASAAAAVDMNWGSLDASSSGAVQVALALKDFDGYPQPVTAKLVLGWDFSGVDSTITITGSGISSVTDSSGNANTGTQTNDARRPLYDKAINGKSVADSDDARSLILPADIAAWLSDGMPPFHVLCVCRIETFTNADNIFVMANAGAAPRTAIRLSTTGGTRFDARFPIAGPSGVSVLSTETTIATGTTYLVETSCTVGAAGSIIVNEGTAATGGTTANSGEALPSRTLFSVTACADAWVGALYLFNDALTAAELAQWRRFLKDRWGYV